MSAAPQPTPPPADWAVARNLRLARRLDGLRVDTAHGRGLIREGVLRRAVGLTLEAVGCEAPLGASCKVEVVDGGWVDAEVVGFAGERTYLMPSAELHGLLPNARVVPSARRGGVEVGEGLLGRVIDSDGVPLDGRARSAQKGMSAWPACRSIRWRVNRSPSRWTWACARSTRCCRSAAASVSACSPVPASASRRCWA
jgi:flagellum-specific ATP synthase